MSTDNTTNRPLLPEFDATARTAAPDWPWLSIEAAAVIAGIVEAIIDTQPTNTQEATA